MQITLLSLYALPLLLLLLGTVTSQGYRHPSDFLVLALTVTGQFIEGLRDSFGFFVVPFVTAYSAASQRSGPGGLTNLQLFFVLVALLAVSIFLFGFLGAREDPFRRNLPGLDENRIDSLYQHARSLTTAYTKELLAYLSLLLGVGVSKST